MTLADKIIHLRKKTGWSQEQLAEYMNISRQSVSKWESGASVPELDKIIKMSDLFGVTTDYLLREEIVEVETKHTPEETEERSAQEEEANRNAFSTQSSYNETPQDTEREVSQEEAVAIMDLAKKLSSKIALGASLCVLSPICLLLLGAIAEYKSFLSEDMAGGIGCAILLLFVAAGAGHLIFYSMKLDKYEYLETENVCILPETRKFVAEKKEAFAPAYQKSVVTGTLLCICGVIPILIAAGFNAKDSIYSLCVCILLGVVAIGVYCFVRYGIIQGSFDKILEEGDYTRDKKAVNKKAGTVAGIYWCFITAAYLGASFLTNQWQITWVLLVIAGILFAACMGIMRLVNSRN